MRLNAQTKFIVICSLFIFLTGLGIGFNLAKDRPLWGDEIRTQGATVDPLSYGEIISGRHIGRIEGNVCPLFYLIQKSILKIFQFHLPQQKWDTYFYDLRSQIIVRINPILFMTLSLTSIFYYFARHYSLLTGVYAVFLGLSSPMIWSYWAEARPYALWIFLTSTQTLLFLSLIKHSTHHSASSHHDKILWRWLMVVHILLALTVFFSLIQIVICTALLWLFVQKNFKKYVLLTLIPMSLCLYYYAQAPSYKYLFNQTAWELITPSFPYEWIVITLLFALFLICKWTKNIIRARREGWDRSCLPVRDDAMISKEGVSFLLLVILMLMAAFFMMFVFKFVAIHGDEQYFVYTRYFIYLVPITIISTTVFSFHLAEAFKDNRWMLFNTMMVLGAFLVIRSLKTYMQIFVAGG